MTSGTGQASFVIDGMLSSYIKRGTAAGIISGIGYGLFILSVIRPLITFVETFESGESAHEAAGLTIATLTSLGASALWALLLGVLIFGVVYYFIEPALPGERDTHSYILAAIGFIMVSGAPWLVFPPQPPGVEQTVSTQTRLVWYVIMMVSGGVVSGAVVYTYSHLVSSFSKVTAGFLSLSLFSFLLLPLAVAPTNTVNSSLPVSLSRAFRWVTAAGQVWLWLLLASAHTWLARRIEDTEQLEAIQTDANLQTASDLE